MASCKDVAKHPEQEATHSIMQQISIRRGRGINHQLQPSAICLLALAACRLLPAEGEGLCLMLLADPLGAWWLEPVQCLWCGLGRDTLLLLPMPASASVNATLPHSRPELISSTSALWSHTRTQWILPPMPQGRSVACVP